MKTNNLFLFILVFSSCDYTTQEMQKEYVEAVLAKEQFRERMDSLDRAFQHEQQKLTIIPYSLQKKIDDGSYVLVDRLWVVYPKSRDQDPFLPMPTIMPPDTFEKYRKMGLSEEEILYLQRQLKSLVKKNDGWLTES